MRNLYLVSIMNQDFWTFAYLKNCQAQVQAPSPIKTPTPKTKTKSLKGTRGITKDLGLMLSYILGKGGVQGQGKGSG